MFGEFKSKMTKNKTYDCLLLKVRAFPHAM